MKNILTRDPVGEDTLFEAASMTKPVFAYVVMRLVDEQRLDLDRPLVAYRRHPERGERPQPRADHRPACAGAFDRLPQLGVRAARHE